jgi:hypothetical protein
MNWEETKRLIKEAIGPSVRERRDATPNPMVAWLKKKANERT